MNRYFVIGPSGAQIDYFLSEIDALTYADMLNRSMHLPGYRVVCRPFEGSAAA